ncbi:MAG: carboxymuconolactone decarboxylase family protein [Micropepsaceae bacterium]
MTEARIKPQEPPFSEAVQKTFERLMPPGVPPLVLFTTLARSERAFSRFMAAGLLDKGPLPLREREIMIDRTCARTGSEYEWGVHIALFAERVVLTKEEVAATLAHGVSDVWSPRERLIVRLADELHDTSTIGDELWTELSQTFSDEQILEMILLAGFYHTVAYLTNGLKLPLEQYAARFPDRA